VDECSAILDVLGIEENGTGLRASVEDLRPAASAATNKIFTHHNQTAAATFNGIAGRCCEKTEIILY